MCLSLKKLSANELPFSNYFRSQHLRNRRTSRENSRHVQGDAAYQLILSPSLVTFPLHRQLNLLRLSNNFGVIATYFVKKLCLFCRCAQSDHKFYHHMTLCRKNRPPRTTSIKLKTETSFQQKPRFYDQPSRTASTCWPGSHKDQALCAKHLEPSFYLANNLVYSSN